MKSTGEFTKELSFNLRPLPDLGGSNLIIGVSWEFHFVLVFLTVGSKLCTF